MLRAFDMVGGSGMTAAGTPIDTNTNHKPAKNEAYTLTDVNEAAGAQQPASKLEQTQFARMLGNRCRPAGSSPRWHRL
jgi:hypothetical protein